ncbi:hypothetical protein [Kosakonia phage Kc304]|uniref:Uncharacterized protein n=2 Tax=Winklervirus chi14 TaxID=2560752 RepID=A0A1Z1LYN2_9CAUD|nr:hypothetical protein FDI23_gp180 [Serratia phage CHI14]ARW57658.1 hypothetical protein [Serratia phage CHI14]ARW57933.1 hypothetical protein [Serratia phage CBH8]QYN80678.1 hypothetical protein [Kosakonia phage Kc304]UYM28887.1 hypothetical protein [Serratia phage vB_SspM_LC53]
MNITLLELEEQKNWPLCPLISAPTIAEYKKDPQKYAPDLYEHGIYEIEVALEAIRGGSDYFWCYSGGPGVYNQGRIKVCPHYGQIVRASALGNINYTNDSIIMIGRFEKQGREILFYPLQEEYR